jgi:hypothetical protein
MATKFLLCVTKETSSWRKTLKFVSTVVTKKSTMGFLLNRTHKRVKTLMKINKHGWKKNAYNSPHVRQQQFNLNRLYICFKKRQMGVLSQFTFERNQAHEDSRLNTRIQSEGCSMTKCRYLRVSHIKVTYLKRQIKEIQLSPIFRKPLVRFLSKTNSASWHVDCQRWCTRRLR